MLSLKEVEIFPEKGTVVGRGHRMDIPIGSLFNGSEVNFVTFVQGSIKHIACIATNCKDEIPLRIYK